MKENMLFEAVGEVGDDLIMGADQSGYAVISNTKNSAIVKRIVILASTVIVLFSLVFVSVFYSLSGDKSNSNDYQNREREQFVSDQTDKSSATTDNDSKTEDDVIYKSEKVCVKRIEETDKNTLTDYELNEINEKGVFTDYNTILIGNIVSVTPAVMEYYFKGHVVSDNVTFFEIRINKLYRGKDIAVNDIVTVGVPYNLNTYGANLPIISQGKEFLVFCYPSSQMKNLDFTEADKYVDYWVRNPWNLLIEKADDYFFVGVFFKDVPGSVKLESIIDGTESDERRSEKLFSYFSDSECENPKETSRSISNIIKERKEFGKRRFNILLAYTINSEKMEEYLIDRIDCYEKSR